MKAVDQGFILQRISYSETSMIVKCFTRDHGLKSFLIQGGKKKHAALIFALAPLEFTFYQRGEEQLAKLYDPCLRFNFPEIQFNPVKASIVFFQAEIILQCLQEGQIDRELFAFLDEELQALNDREIHGNFLLVWMLKLCNILGFYPHLVDREASSFDLINGEIKQVEAGSIGVVSNESVMDLIRFMELHPEDQVNADFSKDQRKALLELLLEYFKYHLSNFNKNKTMEVYQSIWYE